MSTTIDQKVVEMRFDNNQFEKGVSESITSIDNLKASLNFDDLSRGLNNLGVTVSSIGGKLSPLGEMWRQIWSNVADVVWSAAGSINNAISSMGLEQMYAGFSKYTLLSKSVQTIMSATRNEWADQGAQMEYVTSQLEKLNWFTDETSYNFTDMASNIGKFTSSGVSLDQAVTSMMGIATWAGISGAGIQEASRAMYNLSQAIALGYVSIRDWMSIENANMATREFKQTVIDTAVELGTLKRDADGFTYAVKTTKKGVEYLEVTVDNLRSTLGDDYGYWFSSDVLNAALKDYGGFVEELYIQVNQTRRSATELIDLTKDYKDTLVDVKKTAEALGEEDVDTVKKYIQDYTKGTLDLEKLAEKYGTTVDKLSAHFDKYKGTLLDFNVLNKMTDGSLRQTNELKYALDTLTKSEYELGFAALKASQESRTLEDSIVATRDAVSSMWMNIFVAVLGDYLESVELWSSVTEELWDIFVEDLDNTYWLIREWGDLGGREILLEGIETAWGKIKEVFLTVKNTIKELFPEATGESLIELTEKFRDFTNTIGLSTKQIFYLRSTIKFLGNIIQNAWNNVKTIFNALKDAFNDIFPKTKTAVQYVYEFAKAGNKLSESLKITDEQAEKIKRTFKGVFAILDIIGQLISAVLQPIFKKLGMEMTGVGDSILDMTAGWGDWLVSLDDSIRETNFFGKAVDTVIGFINDLKNGIDQLVFSLTKKHIGEIWQEISQNGEKAVGSLRNFFGLFSSSDSENAENTTNSLAKIFEKLTEGIEYLKTKWEEAKPYFDQLMGTINDTFEVETMTYDDFIDAFRKGGALAVLFALAQMLWKVFDTLYWYIFDSPARLIGQITYILESVGDVLWAITNRINAGILTKTARAILYLAVAIALIASIKSDKLENAVITMTVMFAELAGVLDMLNKQSKVFDAATIWAIGRSLRAMGMAVAEIGVALYLVGKSFDKPEDLEAAAAALAIIFGELAAVIYLLGRSRVDGAKMSGIAVAMAVLGIALIEISASLSILMAVGSKTNNIMQAVTALAAMVFVVGFFYKAMSSVDINAGKMAGISTAMAVMGIAFIEFSAAMAIIMAVANKTDRLEDAVVSLGAVMLASTLFFSIMSSQNINPGKIIAASSALVVVSFALIGIATALAIVTQVSGDASFGTGVEGLVGCVAAVVAALLALTKFSDNIGKVVAASAALVIASVGIVALAYAMTLLAQVHDLDVILMLALSLTVLIVAAMFAQKCVPGLLALGAALALIGVGVLAAGAGVLKFSEGVEKLVASGLEGVDVLIYFLGKLGGVMPDFFANLALGFTRFITVLFVDNASVVLDAISNLLIVILEAIRIALPIIIEILKQLFYGFKDLVIDMLPVAMDLILFVTKELLKSMVTITPLITKAAIDILLDTLKQVNENIGEVTYLATSILLEVTFGLLEALIDHIPDFVQVGIDFIIALLEGIALGIDNNTDRFIAAVQHLVEAMITAVCKVLGINSPSLEFLEIGANVIKGLLEGLSNGLHSVIDFLTELGNKMMAKFMEYYVPFRDKAKEIINKIREGIVMVHDVLPKAIENVMNKLLDKIREFFEPIKNKAVELIQKFNAGIYSMVEKVKMMVTNLIDKVLTLIDSYIPGFKDLGWDVIRGLAKGIEDAAYNVYNAIKTVVDNAIKYAKGELDSNSPSKVFMRIGRDTDEGYAIGLSKYSNLVEESSKNVARTAIDTVSTAISNISDMVESEMDTNPTIRPVLDLTDISNGARTINDMFNGNRSINLATRSSTDINRGIVAQNNAASALDDLRNTLSGLSGNGGVVNNNTFNITGDNPKSIANEVNGILQRQVERRDKAWA